MPKGEQGCHLCGAIVPGNNMARHVRRKHVETDDGTAEDPESHHSSRSVSSDRSNTGSGRVTTSARSRSPSSDRNETPGSSNLSQTPRMTDNSAASTAPMSADYLRDAVLCMLRRTSGINVASLSAYLSSFFPEIPESCRIPIIVAAFSAAQKVAATHVDVMLNADSDRVVWAKKSLARWTHGLSAVEPGHVEKDVQKRHTRETFKLSADLDAYSPTTNFLLTRELPVSVESQIGQRQMEADFDALQKTQVVVSREMQAVVPQGQKSLAGQAVQQQLIFTEQLVQPSIEIVDSDVEPDDQPDVQGEISLDDMAEVSISMSLFPPPEEILIDEEDGQLPADVRNLYQSNPVSDPVSLKTGVAGFESLVEQLDHDRSQYETPRISEDEETGVADMVAEPEDVSFSDLLKLPDTETVMFDELSRPLLLLSPLRSPPTPLLSETKLDTRKSDQGQVTRKKKTVVEKTESSSGAQPEIVIDQSKSGSTKENLKRPIKNSDQPLERSPKRDKATQRMEKSPKPKSLMSALKPTESDKFKIPLRPQENQPHSEIHQGAERLSVMSRCYTSNRDQFEDRRRYDRDRRAQEEYHRRPDRRHYRPDHRGLSADQRRWLKRMPYGWRY